MRIEDIPDKEWAEIVESLRLWTIRDGKLGSVSKQTGISVITLNRALRGGRLGFFPEMKIKHWINEREHEYESTKKKK